MPLELAVFNHVWLAPELKLWEGHCTFGFVWASTAEAKKSREIWGFIVADYLWDILQNILNIVEAAIERNEKSITRAYAFGRVPGFYESF
jgi:hypothetical protein